jgi:4-amino-4-deoxy-L-arabinose transferase-like glycosyltransferase
MMDSNIPAPATKTFYPFTRWDAGILLGIGAAIALHFRFGWWEKPFAVQRRIADGEKIRLEDHIVAGFWWAILLTLILALAVACLRPFWKQHWLVAPKTSASGKLTRAFWFGAACIVALAVVVRIPRLDLSLYADEFYPLRMCISGQWSKNKEGETKFKPVDWNRTFFENREANNHVLQSVASRATLDAYRRLTGIERSAFSETALRFPSLVAGIVSILLLGIFCARSAGSHVAILAMFLCAIHPWHVRYSTEARGYAITLAGATLALFALQSAIRTGQWRSWLTLGAAFFLMLGSFPGSIYLVAAINLVLVIWFMVKGPRALGLSRLFVANALAAAAFALLYGPSAQQIIAYMQDPRALSPGISLGWLRDEAAYFLAGMPWAPDQADQPLLIGITNATSYLHPMLGPILFGLLAILCFAGLISGLRKSVAPDGWLLAGSLLAAGLGVVHCQLSGKLLFPWYLVFALPGVLALIASGAGSIARRRANLALPVALIVAVLFTSLVIRQLSVVMRHSREPNREVARAWFPNKDQNEMAGGFWTQAFNYEPRARQLVTAEDVAILIRESQATRSTLRIGFGHRERALATIPDALAMVENPDLFSLENTFHGIEAGQFTHRVYRLNNSVNDVGLTAALAQAKTRRLP